MRHIAKLTAPAGKIESFGYRQMLYRGGMESKSVYFGKTVGQVYVFKVFIVLESVRCDSLEFCRFALRFAFVYGVVNVFYVDGGKIAHIRANYSCACQRNTERIEYVRPYAFYRRGYVYRF